MSWGRFLGVACKMSKKCQKNVWGVQLGFGKMSKKCQKNVPRHFQDIFTKNAPKGARRFAPRPFGGVEGHENGFKMSKKMT